MSETKPLSSPARIKEIAERFGFSFSKSLGQNFLINPSVCPRIAEMGGAKVVGAGIVIEKQYEHGGKDIRDLGYRIESLAKIKKIEDSKIVFGE